MKVSPERNTLYTVQTRMSDIPVIFRDLVCKDNDWSIPTFYRKFKNFEKGTGIMMWRLSPSETRSIISQALVIFNDLGAFLEEQSLLLGIDFQKGTMNIEPSKSSKKSSKPSKKLSDTNAISVPESTAKPVETSAYQFIRSLDFNNLSKEKGLEVNNDLGKGE